MTPLENQRKLTLVKALGFLKKHSILDQMTQIIQLKMLFMEKILKIPLTFLALLQKEMKILIMVCI